MTPLIAMSSGHALHVAGAVGPEPWGLIEVPEARRVVEQVATVLGTIGLPVETFHDNTSKTQSDNLNAIVKWHNAQQRKLDVSVHFNAAQKPTADPLGVEVLYLTMEELADKMSDAIAECGLKNRGPKHRTDLYFLNGTNMPAILIEVAFVNSQHDAALYRDKFNEICDHIAVVLAEEVGFKGAPPPPEVPAKPLIEVAINVPADVDISLKINGVEMLLDEKL